MELGLLAPLVVLALIDSTSFGTLAIPVWLMTHPSKPRLGRILLYLSTIAVFYFVLGLGLYFGAQSLRDAFASLSISEPARWVALVAGAVLLLLGLTIEPWTEAGKKRKRAGEAARQQARGPGRIERWRTSTADGSASPASVMAFATVAALIEAASMLPYLAAIGLMVAADLPPLGAVGVLAAYCVVMIAPALLLLALRLSMHERIQPTLARVDRWLRNNSKETLAWVFALLGLWLISNNWQVARDLIG
ncbi:GAP family protein [Yimella sp. NH-Cas1]|uniref:GAP family protein n=1 Tax=Yimella sp. NH-Cas1 TaxID=2917726 RepID=UPI001EFBC253|nr:GAP family protein [Yimella sp. NH-Cas1]MCG8656837.1 GAP family protein [Yimella sp. NH-Cas1]